VQYDTSVKAKSETPFERFTKAMDSLVRVPHSEIKKALERERLANAGKVKRGPKPKHSSASDRASGSED
jgi:hypothetical protein